MGKSTSIEWTDATWSPITGCSVVSAGCKHCYAMRLAGTRLKHHPSRAGLTEVTAAGPVWNGQVRFNAQWIRQPITWRKPQRIFVCAHGDLFHESVPDHWIDSVFGVMWACLYSDDYGTPGHVFQLPTKRPDRMADYLAADRREQWAYAAVNYGGGEDPDPLFDQVIHHDGPHPRIWLGTSVENRKTAAERIRPLLACDAAVRFLSVEPLLEQVNLCSCDGGAYAPQRRPFVRTASCPLHGERQIDWVIVGGESGPGARPMNPEWARFLRDECVATNVPFFFKQWGAWGPAKPTSRSHREGIETHDWTGPTGVVVAHSARCGKRDAGRLLDGRTWDEFPRCREQDGTRL